MTVSSILDAVREGWNFIWPPCFLLLVLIAITRILAPLSLKDLAAYLGRLLQHQKKVIALLRVYGLGKFVGVIEAFVILFLLYVLRLAIPIVGDAIPGQMTYTPSAMFVQTVDRESLVCALASVPGATIDTLQEEINIRKKRYKPRWGWARRTHSLAVSTGRKRTGTS